MHSTYVSDKQRSAHTQFKFIVKKELVDEKLPSVFGNKTLNVQQHSSNFSTLNTFEQLSPEQIAVLSFSVGILKGCPLHKYNITGLVLHVNELEPQPKNPLSQVSKQVSELQAFC